MNDSGARKRVVVVGAGFGGLSAVKHLSGHGLDVLLIDRNNYHLFQPLLYQVAIAGLDEEEVAAPVRALLRRRPDVRFRKAEVQSVDLAARQVQTADGPIGYDYLVLAAGSMTNFFGNQNIQRRSFDLKKLNDAVALRNHILSMFEQASRTSDPVRRETLMTFVIVGGGPTGVEFSGALAELVRHALKRDFPELHTEEARIILYNGSPDLLAAFPRGLADYAKRRVQKLGVEVRQGTVVDVEGDTIKLKDGTTVEAHTLLWAAGVRVAALADGLDVPKAHGGRIAVQPDFSLADHPEVFVIGDMAQYQEHGQPLPMLVQPAMQGGRYVAQVIARQRERGQAVRPFSYFDKGNVAVIGRYSAVADVFGVRLHGLVAWAIWLGVHLLYLVGFRNRLLALIDWGFAFLLFDSQVRLITQDDPRPADADAPPAAQS